ncbi:class I SAM-dependent methyltransferase [candidate division KSB1 bacterium]
MKNKFIDYYSARSAVYAKYRPKYPPYLFKYLASICPKRNKALDCATGSGQAATGLSEYFESVLASDPSKGQIANANRSDNLHYFVSTAENNGIKSDSIDLATVAQAAHWFDFDLFYDEILRVLHKHGTIAFWSYNLLKITSDIDNIIDNFYWKILKEYWSEERKYVDQDYSTIPFPFNEIEPPAFSMTAKWNLDQLLGYLSSWSAVNNYSNINKVDPVSLIIDDLKSAWCAPDKIRPINWPLNLRIGVVS